VVAVNSKDKRLVAVGMRAKQMIGRAPRHIHVIRPLRDGVIADLDTCEKMLGYFIRRVHGSGRVARPRMVICVPSGVTAVEQRAVRDVAELAGARNPAFIIEKPMAAAIGAGLPVHEPTGNLVVDIGGGTTEVAVISLGPIVTSTSVRVGGDRMDEAVIQFIKKEHSLAVGERTAEQIKIALGSAWPPRRGDLRRGSRSGSPYRAAQDRHHQQRGDPPGHRGAGDGHHRLSEGHFGPTHRPS
jgi:rod shape-determining protein MreB